jgi:hypothetical protein
VVNHFSGFSAPSKKAEHAELERLRLTAMSYRQYLEHVKNGGTIATAAAPLRNQYWLRGAAEQQDVAEQLNTLLEAHSQATKAQEHASKQIVRKKIA